ncbi:TVP38/TMEM64 family protein [Paenibacillus senegalensis]|uniref:TVP38/TMEM64 family protein n=1 Tax=Paenibacillus senegalensis TaxID=1465766 RepID=UPI0002D3DBE1|nr:TVP38/TMEM64 family protein [Paenibacillus senegalensis]
MRKKLAMGLFYAGVAAFIYWRHESIIGWVQSPAPTVVVIMIATLMALFPVIPYPIIGGVIGAAYGPLLGGGITWVGSTAASLLMFLFVRYGYQDWGIRLLYQTKGLSKMTVMFEKNAFLFILFARLIPIIPSLIVNVYSALGKVSFASYAIASSLGKIPSMLLFVLVGDGLVTDPRNAWISLLVYGGFLAVTLTGYKWWRRQYASG